MYFRKWCDRLVPGLSRRRLERVVGGGAGGAGGGGRAAGERTAADHDTTVAIRNGVRVVGRGAGADAGGAAAARTLWRVAPVRAT